MPFEVRKIRKKYSKKSQKKFFRNFEEKTKKRFEHISEKFSKISFPFEKIKLTPLGKKEKVENCAPETKISEEIFSLEEEKKYSRRRLLAIFIVLFAGACVFAYQSLSSLSFSEIGEKTVKIATTTIGEDLQTDYLGRTNILLLGSGGDDSDGGYLTDSIIVASIHEEKGTLSMFSIPRDMYADFTIAKRDRSGKINGIFRDSMEYWKYRERERDTLFSNAANDTRQKIEEIVGVNIHYTVYIDFAGFEKIVDQLGGITVDVESRIDDPIYPSASYGYEPFRLEKGLQKLDGETALKYVRSRHGTSGGDFGRSHRQKKAIVALKNKAIETGVFSSVEQMQELFNIMQDNIWTDLSFPEMLTLVNFGKDLSKQNIVSVGVTNEAEIGIGGFLYDGLREDFNGMSVFLPYLRGEGDEYRQIKFFFEGVSLYSPLMKKPGMIEIYNTTAIAGLATKVEAHLLRYAIVTSKVENFEETYKATTVKYVATKENEEIVSFLQRKLDMEFVSVPVSQDHPENIFKIYIGKDYSSNPYIGTLIRTPSKRDDEKIFTN